MPQVDLSPLFTPPPKNRAPRPEPFVSPDWKDPENCQSTESRSRFPISLAQLTNVGFVLAACLGAVVITLYFIGGGELLQEVSAWPRELFSGRPVARPAAPVITILDTSSKADSGDPFSPTSKLLSFNPPIPTVNQPNSSSSSVPFTSAPFSRLNMSAPDGDVLSRSLTESAPPSEVSTANATESVGQTARIQQQTTAPVKAAVTAHSKTGTARIRSGGRKLKSAGTKLKSKGFSASSARLSRSRGGTGGASTTGIAVAEPGSHIGSLSTPIGPPPSANGSMTPMTRGSRAGAGSAMNSIRGAARIGGH